jgi:hypothetical protein
MGMMNGTAEKGVVTAKVFIDFFCDEGIMRKQFSWQAPCGRRLPVRAGVGGSVCRKMSNRLVPV